MTLLSCGHSTLYLVRVVISHCRIYSSSARYRGVFYYNIESEGTWCVVKTDSSTIPITISVASVIKMSWEPGWGYDSVVVSAKQSLERWKGTCWHVHHVSSLELPASIVCMSPILTAVMGMK